MIKLILSAPEPAMAAAFECYFQNTDNVEIIRRPFETVPEFDCMVSAANSFGLMDGGVDAAITTYFGTQLQRRVQKYIIQEYLGEQPVGTAFITETGDGEHPWLVHAPTMRVPLIIDGTDAVYNATRAALLAIFQHNKSAAEYKKIKSVVFPAMGAGCGQVPPDSVARQMRLAWDGFINCATEINWQYASDRQNAVFSTTAYCPQTLCPNASSRYIGSGDYRTYCTKSGGVCISPRHQSDIRIGAHAHGVEIGAHGHPLHTECSHAHSLV
ncbi:macro domain-containing protein [Salmonella enterica]|uniref:macro domain-containing protein n=1 Tax=Salmonella enterica TaxID=28901 RepID=UPI0013811388|nr:macro domain-containing protein [Salmonella enterica]ECX5680489.1 phage tail protein [Salmonella enterica subsp. enterica serovar Newport]EDW1894540.1 phage tail protein [Salmonella enterica subsp. enterica serovar Bovismorbificans]EEK2359984.1 phage tail protein [Salmonella enterica subsp. enterica serovar Muenchen]EHO8008082.1 macro domain-containing protein [Salmonella enterica]EIC2702610.1 macro domain-containing protein [Salmonella enterica]